MSEERKRLNFDPTINLGHVLTFVGFIATGFAAYSALDKRVTVLESEKISASAQATDRQSEQKESLKEIKADIKDLQRSVNEIGRAVVAGKGKP